MNYLGVYRSNYPRSVTGICDAPCVSKGKMLLCGPKIVSEGRLIAMVHGRIRNRSALQRQLGLPNGASDAQLALHAYRVWGTDFPARIEGPAAVCVMDAENDRMVLARDRMGEQPIFYARVEDGGVVFSDHPDSLLKSNSARALVDADGLRELFGMGPARTPGRTPLKDVLSLESGCALICEGGVHRVERYFTLREEPHRDSEADTIRRVRLLLEQAVDDVLPLSPGAMLSGGLDSTALTALLSRRMAPVRTFSVDYRDNEADFQPSAFRPSMDAPFIEEAVRAYRTEQTTFVLEQAELAGALEEAVSARGFPGMADIDSSLMLFARKIRPHCAHVVSGECGDEVFGGYPWFRGEAELRADAFPWSGSVALRESTLRPDLRKKLDLPGWIRASVARAVADAEIEGDGSDREVRLKRMQKMCFQFFMANLQERALRMCGQCGLDVLTPLCDDRLVQYVFSVPWSMKFMNGMEKGLFRAAVSDLMPESLNRRRKSPYPKTCSPVYTEIVRGLTLAMLADRDAPILEWIDEDFVRKIALSPMDPNETPWFGQLMAGPQMLAYLWQVNAWMRERNVTVSL